MRGPVPRAGLRGGKGSGDWGGVVGGRPAACGAELRAGRWGCGRGALSTSALCLQAGPGVRVWQNVYRGCRGGCRAGLGEGGGSSFFSSSSASVLILKGTASIPLWI